MKPTPHTIQWLAPHLSDGEVQALYEAMKRVIGHEQMLTKEHAESILRENRLKRQQHKELSRLFGKETG